MKLNQQIIAIFCFLGAVPLAMAQDTPAPARPQYSPEQVFKLWDKNGDGELTADEVPKPELFKMLDRNGDGSVTKEEIATMGKGGAAPGGRSRSHDGSAAVERESPALKGPATDRLP